MSILENVVSVAPVIQNLIPLDSCVMISNEEGVIVKFLAAKTLDMKASEGTHAVQGGSIDEALTTRKIVHKVLNRDLYGIPVKAIAQPLYEGTISWNYCNWNELGRAADAAGCGSNNCRNV